MVYGRLFEPLIGMAHALSRTERLKVGTGVSVLPGRHPVLVAKQLASLAGLAPGRVLPVFGLRPARRNERDLFPVPAGQRAAVFDESLELLRLLLRQDTVSFDGEFFTVEGPSIGPLPAQPLDTCPGRTAPRAPPARPVLRPVAAPGGPRGGGGRGPARWRPGGGGGGARGGGPGGGGRPGGRGWRPGPRRPRRSAQAAGGAAEPPAGGAGGPHPDAVVTFAAGLPPGWNTPKTTRVVLPVFSRQCGSPRGRCMQDPGASGSSAPPACATPSPSRTRTTSS